jgi:hypothetical protein
MQITGYKLQHAIREAEHMKNLAASQWDDSLYAFADDEKTGPAEVMGEYRVQEERLCYLQEAQARYNLRVTVDILGSRLTLCRAIKLVGGAGRAEKMWRAAASGEKKDRYSLRSELTRNKDEDRARRTISVKDASNKAKTSARYAASLREAIQVGNATAVEIELDESLFE